MGVWPRMTHLERAITQVALVGLTTAMAVGALTGLAIDRILHRGDR